MNTRRPCYVAGPYKAADAMTQALNVGRAAALARLALAEGLAPIVVHPAIAPMFGPVDTDEIRALGLAWAETLVETVARTALGVLWVLELEDGTLSPGTRREVLAWKRARGEGGIGRRGTWADFRQAFRAAGLEGLWLALERPATPADLVAELQARGLL